MDSLAKYWSVIIAIGLAISWLGGFVVTVGQIQNEQAAIKLKIVELEQRQTKTEDKVNTQNVEVLTRLARMEAILEELRKK